MNHELAAQYEKEILAALGEPGRLLALSKSDYARRHADHVVVSTPTSA